MSYDLRQLRLHGLIQRIPGAHRYTVTDHGFHLAVFPHPSSQRLVQPGLSDIPTDHDPDTPLRREFRRLNAVIEADARKHRLIA